MHHVLGYSFFSDLEYFCFENVPPKVVLVFLRASTIPKPRSARLAAMFLPLCIISIRGHNERQVSLPSAQKLSQRHCFIFFLDVTVVIYISKFCPEMSFTKPYVSSLSLLQSHSLVKIYLQLHFWNLQGYRKRTIDCIISFFVAV
jgi:RNase adaptor protein for sRNA GlmZ degradation